MQTKPNPRSCLEHATEPSSIGCIACILQANTGFSAASANSTRRTSPSISLDNPSKADVNWDNSELFPTPQSPHPFRGTVEFRHISDSNSLNAGPPSPRSLTGTDSTQVPKTTSHHSSLCLAFLIVVILQTIIIILVNLTVLLTSPRRWRWFKWDGDLSPFHYWFLISIAFTSYVFFRVRNDPHIELSRSQACRSPFPDFNPQSNDLSGVWSPYSNPHPESSGSYQNPLGSPKTR